MAVPEGLPVGLELVRTTPTFDETSVPPALLAEYQVAESVWGRLVVHGGELAFVFEGERSEPHSVTAGESMVIPPSRPHHVELVGPVRFAIEFHRAARP